MFFKLLIASFHGIAEVFIIGLIGYLIVSGRGGEKTFLDYLTKLVIRLTLPCLVLYNIIGKFIPGETEYWWAFPILAVALNLFGAGLAYIYLMADRTVKTRGEFAALVAFQNGIFLPLAFAPVFFGGEELPVFLNLLFLFNLLSIPTFFTLAVWMVHSSSGRKSGFVNYINLPIVATFVGAAVVLAGFGKFAPEWVLRPLGTIGSMTGTLSMLFIGGIIITNLRETNPGDWLEPLKITILKNLILPGIVSAVVYVIHPPQYIGLFAIMQSAMPSALLVALIVPGDSGSRRTTAGAILMSSLVSIFTVPLFMGIFGSIYG